MTRYCTFGEPSDGCRVCTRCGRVVRSVAPKISARCKAPPGLGDMVAAGLAAIGITKERVSAALGRPCGCAARAEALNELGRRIGIG